MTVVVADDAAEAYMQALNDALDRLDERFEVYSSEIKESETETRQSAAEPAASGS